PLRRDLAPAGVPSRAAGRAHQMGVGGSRSRMSHQPRRVVIPGGAGFIGSYFVDHLMASSVIDRVTIFDNFSSGQDWHIAGHRNDPRLHVMRGEIADLPALVAAMEGADTVIHLASNPDIARA